MSERVYRFRVELRVGPTVDLSVSSPIYNDDLQLVGAFTSDENGHLIGFISGSGHPLALNISTEEFIWFTPLVGSNGQAKSALVSESKMNEHSVKVRCTEDSNE